MKIQKYATFGKDGRRKHHHWQVTLFYKDGETFARMYTDRDKAAGFAERQRKSPVVKTARVTLVS
jgi:hypothetical protein